MLWKARSRIDIIQSIGRLKEILPETTVFNHLSRVLFLGFYPWFFLWSSNSTAVYCESASDRVEFLVRRNNLLTFCYHLSWRSYWSPSWSQWNRHLDAWWFGRTFVSLAWWNIWLLSDENAWLTSLLPRVHQHRWVYGVYGLRISSVPKIDRRRLPNRLSGNPT